MFTNIIGHENTIRLLKSDVINGTLTNSMIFAGKKYTGKMKTAIELTRILNCELDGYNDCNCNNCKRINDLNFEGLILLSRRNYINLLQEYIECFKENKEQKSYDNILNTIMLMLSPLQDLLIKDSYNEQDKKQLGSSINLISEILDNDKKISFDKIIKCLENIYSVYKKLNIPVNTIRSMLDWTYISQPDIKRVVIIDHFEYLENSSQNILLKRLEEPSENLYFILLTENKNNILQTIKSRCRLYRFRELDKDDVKKIIKISFHADGDYDSIEDYLMRNEESYSKNLFPVVIKLLNLVFVKDAPFTELTTFINAYKDRKLVKSLLLEISTLLEKEISIREIGLENESDLKMLQNISVFTLRILNNIIVDRYNIIDRYSLNPVLLLEGLFYPLKAMVYNDQF